MRRSHLLVGLLAIGASPLGPEAQAADMVLLQQNVVPDQAGVAFLMIDRDRLVAVRARKEKGFEHVIELTLVAEPVATLSLRCVDQAATRQVLDALRPRGTAALDISGRCRL
jgi:hypothetical protein